MHYTIESSRLTATVSSTGAELQSLGSNNRDFLWHGEESVWAGKAPILFPIVGSLKNNQYLYKNQLFELPKHGVARHAEFDCIHHTGNELTLQLTSSASTLKAYPWAFILTVTFRLVENTLQLSYAVTNQSETPMLFTIGSHPAFLLAHPVSDYAIKFSHSESLQHYPLTSEGLLQNGVDYLQHTDILPLHNRIFENDALVFKNIKSDTISLYEKGQPLISVDTGGAPHLGLWAKPAASFVCIEPWFGHSDHTDASGEIESKPSMITLNNNTPFNYNWAIVVHPA